MLDGNERRPAADDGIDCNDAVRQRSMYNANTPCPNDTLPPTVFDGTTSRQRIKVVAVEHASRGARLPPPGAHGGPSPWRAFTWRRTWNARARGQPLGAHSGGAAEAASETALTHLVVLSSVASAAEEASWKAFALQEELDPGGWCPRRGAPSPGGEHGTLGPADNPWELTVEGRRRRRRRRPSPIWWCSPPWPRQSR